MCEGQPKTIKDDQNKDSWLGETGDIKYGSVSMTGEQRPDLTNNVLWVLCA